MALQALIEVVQPQRAGHPDLHLRMAASPESPDLARADPGVLLDGDDLDPVGAHTCGQTNVSITKKTSAQP